MQTSSNNIPGNNIGVAAEIDERAIEVTSFWTVASSKLASQKYEGRENSQLIYGSHWNDEDKDKYIEQKRIPVDMPILYPKAQVIIGYEKMNRQSFFAEAVGKEDELTAQIMTALYRSVEKHPYPKAYEDTKSDVFKDGFISFFGASETYCETDALGKKQIKIRHIPYERIVFDWNFKDVECTEMSRIQEVYLTYADELIQMFPEKADLIENLPDEAETDEEYPIQPTENPHDEVATSYKKKKIRRYRDWKWVNIDVWQLWGTGTQVREEYRTRAEAINRKKEIIDERIQQAKDIIEQDRKTNAEAVATQGAPKIEYPDINEAEIRAGFEKQIVIKGMPKRVVEYCEVAGNVLLVEPYILDVDDEMPVKLYFSIFHNGFITTPITVGKSLQKYGDRMFSQADYQLGIDAKGGGEIDITLIDKNTNSADEVMDAYTSGKFAFKRGNGQLLTPFRRSGGNPMYQAMLELVLTMVEEMFGGKTFMGQSDFAGQSGYQTQLLQQQASMMATEMFDNLKRYDLQVGRCLTKYIQYYYDHEKVVKVQGKYMTDKILQALTDEEIYEPAEFDEGWGWLYINKTDEHKKKMALAELDIVIKRVSTRMDEKEIKFNKLAMLEKIGKVVPVQMYTETMDLSATEEATLKEAEKAQQEAQNEEKMMAVAQKVFDNNLQTMDNITNAGHLIQRREQAQKQEQEELL